jgi:hypothetical protein
MARRAYHLVQHASQERTHFQDMNNPPAFPSGDVRQIASEEGMTLRDYFAAKALQGMLSNTTTKVSGSPVEGFKLLSEAAFVIADAMLKARES